MVMIAVKEIMSQAPGRGRTAACRSSRGCDTIPLSAHLDFSFQPYAGETRPSLMYLSITFLYLIPSSMSCDTPQLPP